VSKMHVEQEGEDRACLANRQLFSGCSNHDELTG
jgi:hypothetical protein